MSLLAEALMLEELAAHRRCWYLVLVLLQNAAEQNRAELSFLAAL